MEREYGRAYEQLYRRHWWWRAREEFLVSLLKKTPLPAPTAILDVGCGGGWFFDRLRRLGGQVEGVEPERALVSDDVLLRHKIHVGPFDRSFQPGKRYSLILMLDVLEHWTMPRRPWRTPSSCWNRRAANDYGTGVPLAVDES